MNTRILMLGRFSHLIGPRFSYAVPVACDLAYDILRPYVSEWHHTEFCVVM